VSAVIRVGIFVGTHGATASTRGIIAAARAATITATRHSAESRVDSLTV
jgi:hypothetical protein